MESARYRPEWLDVRRLAKPYLGLLDFRGRSTRTEVFCYYFVYTIAVLALLFVGAATELAGSRTSLLSPRSAVEEMVQLVLSLPLVALMFRRLQDIGRNGWLSVPVTLGGLALGIWHDAQYRLGEAPLYPEWGEYVRVPLLLCFFAIILIPGTEGPNRYGPDPRL